MCSDKRITQDEMRLFSYWMNFMVTEAEELYGANSGRAKLLYVYTKIIEKYPKIANLMSIEEISDYVDKIKSSDAWKKIARAAGLEVE